MFTIALDWYAFGLGLFGAFVFEFIRYTSDKLGPQKHLYAPAVIIVGVTITKFSIGAILTSAVYVAIGGAFAMFLSPTTAMQAIALGAGWQIGFSNLVGGVTGGK